MSQRRKPKKEDMDPRLWHKVAAVSGVAALGLGTYGAHGFKPKNPSYKEVWQTASLYYVAHTAALLAAPITTHPNIFGGLLTTGILAFSGTCYAVAYLEDRMYSRLAPFGGFAFIGAWASLLLVASEHYSLAQQSSSQSADNLNLNSERLPIEVEDGTATTAINEEGRVIEKLILFFTPPSADSAQLGLKWA